MGNSGIIALLDDEKEILRSLEKFLKKRGFLVRSFSTGEEAVAYIASNQPVDVFLSDIRLPNMDGLEILSKIREIPFAPPVIMMTAYGTIENAVEAMKAGAYEYLTKPFQLDELLLVIERAMELVSLRKEVQRLRNEMERKYSIGGLIAKSKIMQAVLATAGRMASEKSPVLLEGASGTGKEFLAQVIHKSGDRADKPFESISCSAVPKGLQKVQLVGDAKNEGLLIKAEGGILFLDEIDALSTEAQLLVLSVLEEGRFSPEGVDSPISCDVRVIAAVQESHEKDQENGSLRRDLYFKMSPYKVAVPELNKRREDIPLLAESFLENFCSENSIHRKKFSPETYKVLLNYSWPGNIRELQNVVERAAILSTKEEIEVDDLPPQMTRLSQVDPAQLPSSFTLEELEKAYIYQVLQENNNHQGRTAKALGIDRKTLYRKIKSYYPELSGK